MACKWTPTELRNTKSMSCSLAAVTVYIGCSVCTLCNVAFLQFIYHCYSTMADFEHWLTLYGPLTPVSTWALSWLKEAIHLMRMCVCVHGFVCSSDVLLLKLTIWTMRQFIHSPLEHPKIQRPLNPLFIPIFLYFCTEFWNEMLPLKHTNTHIHRNAYTLFMETD